MHFVSKDVVLQSARHHVCFQTSVSHMITLQTRFILRMSITLCHVSTSSLYTLLSVYSFSSLFFTFLSFLFLPSFFMFPLFFQFCFSCFQASFPLIIFFVHFVLTHPSHTTKSLFVHFIISYRSFFCIVVKQISSHIFDSSRFFFVTTDTHLACICFEYPLPDLDAIITLSSSFISFRFRC